MSLLARFWPDVCLFVVELVNGRVENARLQVGARAAAAAGDADSDGAAGR